VIGLLIYVYRRREKLKREHLKQMATFLRNMDDEENERKLRKHEVNSYLSPETEDKLTKLMEVDKVYLQKNINLSSLAEMIGTNATYLSQYINNQLKTNFNDYINSQRINEACRLFRSNSSLKYSIDQIADKVGFSSRTTFYTTFKKFTGITPAFFQRYILTPEVQYTEEKKADSVSE
jgi:YesN/AraC family two-component response regulator